MRWTYFINIDGDGHFVRSGPDGPLYHSKAEAHTAMIFALDSVFPGKWEMYDDTQPIFKDKNRQGFVAGYVRSIPTLVEGEVEAACLKLGAASISETFYSDPVAGDMLRMANAHIGIALGLLNIASDMLHEADER